ncbi:MAG: ABC transporter ATP-binding protein [Promethearchaeota archaeon]
MTEVVSLNDVWKFYGKNQVLKEINFKVKKGELLVLLGSNGSGKTTLLRLISTLSNPDKGFIRLFGTQIENNKKSIRRDIGMLFDQPIHWEHLSGYQNAWFFARSHGLSKQIAESRLNYLFKWINLQEKKNDLVKTYSYGMKRKLALIETLSHQPKILLLDEPSMGLDYTSRLSLFDLLKSIIKSGSTIILATNDVNEAALLAHKVLLLRKGNIVAFGEPKKLMNSLNSMVKFNLKLVFPIPLSPIKEIEGVKGVEIETSKDNEFKMIILTNPKSIKEIPLILAKIFNKIVEIGGFLSSFEVKNPNLGDLFLKLKGD